MTDTHAKGQGQRSVCSKIRVETDGQTDRRRDCISSSDDSVIRYYTSGFVVDVG